MRGEFTFSTQEINISEGQTAAWADVKLVLLEENCDPKHRASYDALMAKKTLDRTPWLGPTTHANI